MAFSAKAVANYILDLAENDGEALSPMKLQKLVYFAHGWHLAITGKPLINEQVEAWQWGPVIKSLYHEFKEYGNQPIVERAGGISFERDGGFHLTWTVPSMDEESVNAEDTETAKEIIRRVWDVYKGLTAVQLSKMTHESGTPWDKTNKRHGGNLPKGTDIPAGTIRRYFATP